LHEPHYSTAGQISYLTVHCNVCQEIITLASHFMTFTQLSTFAVVEE